jgi:hypothetical protein
MADVVEEARASQSADGGGSHDDGQHQKRNKQDEGMKVWKIKQYLPALLWYVQRRLEGGRGFLVAVRTRDVCGVDRRCGMAVHLAHDAPGGEGTGDAIQKGYLPNREEGGGGGVDGPEAVDMTTVWWK